jgi:integrase
MKKKNTFTIPKLCNRGNDLSKSWYVYFTFTNQYGIAKQFRFKLELNTYKTKRERDREAGSMITVLHSRLLDGWNPILDKIEKTQEDITISQAFDNLLSIKKSFITPRSYKTYFDQLSLFKKWLIIAKFDKLFVQNFTHVQARQYFDWLLQVKGYGGKTHNGHLGVISTFFNGLVERQTIQKNPTKGIRKVPQDTGKNTTYSSTEERKLEKYMIENEKNFYFVTRFIRYCFFRRSELAKLQVKHIRWENKTIIVPSESSKSRIQDSVTISKTLEKIILEMNILELEPNMYIFGKHFKPSLEKLKRVDDFSDNQRKINKKLKVKDECTFYSWKHTGAVELYNITKDPYVVMRQCRHSDIKMTMIYLRSLGCGVNEQVREW